MKPTPMDSRTVRALYWAVVIVLAFILWAASSQPHASGDMPPPTVEAPKVEPPAFLAPRPELSMKVMCGSQNCLMPRQGLEALLAGNHELSVENDRLRRELDKAAKGKKCAVLEIKPSAGGRS
jgi:hypothetical protein